MNDWVGFLDGHPQAKTPNMDRLAKRGVNFTNAHCIAPACSPCSDLGLLLGVEPFHPGLYPFYDQPKIPRRRFCQNTRACLELFRENGYQTFGAGKDFSRGQRKPPVTGITTEPTHLAASIERWKKATSKTSHLKCRFAQRPIHSPITRITRLLIMESK